MGSRVGAHVLIRWRHFASAQWTTGPVVLRFKDGQRRPQDRELSRTQMGGSREEVPTDSLDAAATPFDTAALPITGAARPFSFVRPRVGSALHVPSTDVGLVDFVVARKAPSSEIWNWLQLLIRLSNDLSAASSDGRW